MGAAEGVDECERGGGGEVILRETFEDVGGVV